jgi:hypothetical protein
MGAAATIFKAIMGSTNTDTTVLFDIPVIKAIMDTTDSTVINANTVMMVSNMESHYQTEH